MATFFKKNIWTQHSQLKIKQYGLSKQKLLGILYRPERKEQGIAPGTTAVMKTNRSSRNLPALNNFSRKIIEDKKRGKFHYTAKKAPGEIWLMYKDTKDSSTGSGQVRKIISAWRYPGISKPGEAADIIAKYSDYDLGKIDE